MKNKKGYHNGYRKGSTTHVNVKDGVMTSRVECYEYAKTKDENKNCTDKSCKYFDIHFEQYCSFWMDNSKCVKDFTTSKDEEIKKLRDALEEIVDNWKIKNPYSEDGRAYYIAKKALKELKND